jgi:hypothetical protein
VSVSQVEEIAAGAWVLVIGGYWLSAARVGGHAALLSRRKRRRAQVAEAAAVEASLEEPAFAPERLREAVDEVLAVAREVGSPGGGPSDRPDAALITRWAGSLAAALGGEIRLDASPRVEILRVVNRPGQLEDRVIVRVRLRLLRRHHPLVDPHTLTLDQRWTFGRAGELWTLRSIDSSSSEERTLAQRLIPTEWTDEQRLREQALIELADAERVPPSASLGELVRADLPPHQKLLELSQIDGRFDPALIDAVLHHLVDAWEAATTGSVQPLENLCAHGAVHKLRYPAPTRRPLTFVLSDAQLTDWEATDVDVSAEHPHLQVRISVVAVRYVIESAIGDHVAGSRETPRRLQLIWTLGLFSADRDPWRLLSSTNPTIGILDLPYAQPDHLDEQLPGTEMIEARATRIAEQLNAVRGDGAQSPRAPATAASGKPGSVGSATVSALRALAARITRRARR